MNDLPKDDAWLARPSSIRLLWKVLWGVLALTVAAQLVIKIKGFFGADDWFAFGAVYGFLACVAMVLVAKGLGYLIKRDENYYAAEDERD